MDIKEQIHGLTEEMLTNLGRLVAIDSQLGTPAEDKPAEIQTVACGLIRSYPHGHVFRVGKDSSFACRILRKFRPCMSAC